MNHRMTDPKAPVDCVVKLRAGDYISSTVRGQRASSTMSAEETARRLARKLFGEGPHEVLQVGGCNIVGVWRMTPAGACHA